MASLDRIYCNFTEECDKYLNELFSRIYEEWGHHTYIYKEYMDEKQKWIPFRVVGATRGAIRINYDTMEILEVCLYETAYKKKGMECYTQDVENVKDMVGEKLIIYSIEPYG